MFVSLLVAGGDIFSVLFSKPKLAVIIPRFNMTKKVLLIFNADYSVELYVCGKWFAEER